MGQITMSIKESNQIGILERLKKREITQVQAAKQMGLCDRQIRRKLDRFLKGGAQAVTHKLRGKPSNRSTDPMLKKKALALIKNHYNDFGPTLAAEQLAATHGIVINSETLRKFMIEADLWHAKRQRIHHRKWRERRAQFGQMALLDGSLHFWLEKRGPKFTLLLYIDDATGLILQAFFANGESTKNVMRVSKDYFLKHGLPEEIYTDRGGVFKVSVNNPDCERITQFQRALSQLNVRLIHARSPQAKGRVERCFKTLQDRLVKELRLANICTLDAANRYLQDIYIPKHNAQFAVAARQKGNGHRKAPLLDNILCIKIQRSLNSDFTLKLCSRFFQLHAVQKAVIRPRELITIQENLDDSIKLSIRGIWLNFDEIKCRPDKPQKIKKINHNIQRPGSLHPWKTSYKNISVHSPNGGYF